jgi:hypothetical protein
MKKIFQTILLICIFTFVPYITKANGPIVHFDIPNKNIGVGTDFYIDIMLDVQGSDINGIEGKISVPNNDIIKLVRVEDGQSIIRAWLVHPDIVGDTINFSGIIPNGFTGVIDPINSEKKKSGNIMRLVFHSLNPGKTTVSVYGIEVTDNDGLGTNHELGSSSVTIDTESNTVNTNYKIDDTNKPELIASVEKDENLFEYKYTLIFQAIDRGTGIQDVKVKEGLFGAWKVARSPYLLEDQSHQSIIKVKATDFAYNFVTVVIYPPLYAILGTTIIVFIVVLLALLFVKKNKKKRHAKIK